MGKPYQLVIAERHELSALPKEQEKGTVTSIKKRIEKG
jgi:hypothetical protein